MTRLLSASPANPLGQQWGDLTNYQRWAVTQELQSDIDQMRSEIRFDKLPLAHDVVEPSAQAQPWNQAGGAAPSAVDVDYQHDRLRGEAKRGLGDVSSGLATTSMEEFRRREAGSRQKLESALVNFVQKPTQDRMTMVQVLMGDYQANWMEGRKRVTVQE